MEQFLKLPAKDKIKENYSKYNQLLKCLLTNIEEKITKDIVLDPKPVYKRRVKSFESYYSKLLRLKAKEASDCENLVCLTDLMGIRIVCAFIEDVNKVENIIKKKYNVKEVEHKGERQSFREFGYESTHILIAIPQDCLNLDSIEDPEIRNLPIPENLVCEIQVRTILQDAWAEVEHELIYKTEFTPFDAPLRRKLASINASLSLADIIFQEIRDYQTRLAKEVDERRTSFYEKADFITDGKESVKTEEEPAPQEFERVSPYIYGTIDEMILAALQAHNEGKLSQAVEIYSLIIEKASDKPVLAVIHKHRGMAYFAQNDYDNALKDFQMSAEFDPKGFRQLYYEGIVYSIKGDFNSAIECFDKSLEINEFQSHCFYRRALAYFELTDYQASLRDLNAAKSLGLNNEECKALHEKLVKKFDMGM